MKPIYITVRLKPILLLLVLVLCAGAVLSVLYTVRCRLDTEKIETWRTQLILEDTIQKSP
ncbi:MAG: hypothetical protein IJD83_06810 [Clostridia bacterium]|nr:hypothetical protein [Clostridia bacterium]